MSKAWKIDPKCATRVVDENDRTICTTGGHTDSHEDQTAQNQEHARRIAQLPVLEQECRKIVAWLERLAKNADEIANDTRFPSLVEANRSDARNYRATARSISKALAAAGK